MKLIGIKYAVMAVAVFLLTGTAAHGREIIGTWTSSSTTVTLDTDGTVVVSGTGAMGGTNGPTPRAWHNVRNAFINLVIEEGVTHIGKSAFEECAKLETVTIPASVTSIGDAAFSRCSTLTSITLPNSITDIGQYVFRGCISLTEVTIPNSVTSISTWTFNGCTGLASVTIPSGVTEIGEGAFQRCTGLESITFPNTLTSIGRTSFASSGLTSITIPNSVLWGGYQAFDACTSLTSVVFEDGASTSIGSYMFDACKNLTSVILPSNATTIGMGAFRACNNLKTIRFPKSMTDVDDVLGDLTLTTAISENPLPPQIRQINRARVANTTLYVPANSVTVYSNADGWKDFGSIRSIDEYISVTYRVDRFAPYSAPRVSVRNNTLTVRPSSPESVSQVRLIDMRGKSVATFTARGNDNFSLGNIPAGRYFVEVREGARMEWASVVVGGR